MRHLHGYALVVALLFSRRVTPCLHHRDLLANWTPPTIQVRSGKIPPTNTTTALTNVRIFDGYTVHKPSTVIFNGDGILSTDGDATKGHVDTIIDGANGVLIPGLIDSHSHPLTLEHLSSLASFGVTTALSMSCFNSTICDSLHHHPGLTNVHRAGIPATSPNSTHARLPDYPQEYLVSSAADAPGFVARERETGSEWVKLIAESDGMDTPTHVALVAAAHAVGLRTQTHAVTVDSWEQAIASRTSGIQHSAMDGLLTPAMIAAVQELKQSVTPTLTIAKLGGVPPNSTLAPILWANARTNLDALREADIPILAGTDANDVANGTLLPIAFGSSLHDELGNLVEAGWMVADALKAATEVPARVYGLRDRGVIKAGMRADLVLLRGNPLVCGINGTRDIVGTWVQGVKWAEL